jgi:hypothetical protein
LQASIGETEPIPDELCDRLLRQRRILVIVDHLSEMSEATRKEIRPGHLDFLVNALIVTSRLDEKLDEAVLAGDNADLRLKHLEKRLRIILITGFAQAQI